MIPANMKRILKNGIVEPMNNNSKTERKKTEQYQKTTIRVKDKIDMGRSKTYNLTLSRKDDKIRSYTYTKSKKQKLTATSTSSWELNITRNLSVIWGNMDRN